MPVRVPLTSTGQTSRSPERMFPPSLHKNIRELDKQITLLESECENLESEKRKKSKMYFSRSKEFGSVNKKSVKNDIDRPYVTGPRVTNSNSTNRGKSQRYCLKSSSRIPSKSISRTTPSEDVSKSTRRHSYSCSLCGNNGPSSGSRINCSCGKPLNVPEKDIEVLETTDQFVPDKDKKVLHKGILHANPGGTIEVTVTQKPHRGSSSDVKEYSCKRFAVATPDKDINETCSESSIMKDSPLVSDPVFLSKPSPRSQKWSEILSQDNERLTDNLYKINSLKNFSKSACSNFLDPIQIGPRKHASDGDTHINHLKFRNLNNDFCKWNDENKGPLCNSKKVVQNVLIKRNVENVIDSSPKMSKHFEEKEVQCLLQSEDHKSEISEDSNRIKALQNIIDLLKAKSAHEENGKFMHELDKNIKSLIEEGGHSRKGTNKVNDDLSELHIERENEQIRKLKKQLFFSKKLCEKLTKEKTLLSEDLEHKDRLLHNLMNKEKDYLSAITTLKVNLEKKRTQAEGNAEVMRELNAVKDKLDNEAKVMEALRKSHAKIQEQFQRCMLENDKLKTEIRLNKLESQKFCVLLAGKDAEIKRYKEEVESFQRQITEQLMALRSNNAVNEVQKAMEAIIQHSQVFSQTDLESIISETLTDEKTSLQSSKQREKLIHSSPTSTKSSILDSSWNHISSIHDDESKTAPDGNGTVLGELNGFEAEETDENEPIRTIQLFEKKVFQSSRRNDEEETKKDPSFVSCKSVDEEEAVTGLENGELIVSDLTECKELDLNRPDDDRMEMHEINQKVQRKIRKLFRDVKIRCSRKIFTTANDDFDLEDFLNASGTSAASEISDGLTD